MTTCDHDAEGATRPVMRALDWLDSRPAWQFLLVLYAARWLIVIPYILLVDMLFSESALADTSAIEPAPSIQGIALFLGVVIAGPIIETIVECAIPYALFAKVRKYGERRPARPWGFIVASAVMMMLLHPIAGALFPAFITGMFLGYCYAHFARLGTIRAVLGTLTFHACINVVGYVMFATM